uniref:TF-B3 domain-containing protein n=1 Tax=Salix viminalis TaxID=40686 RepID=A0A6N2MLV9_SALVM
MEIELVKKQLTRTDIASCLAYPTGNLWAFQMGPGQNGHAELKNHGRYKKPVIRGDWLGYVDEKGLTVDDFIILTMVEDAENGVSYNIRVEPNLELAMLLPKDEQDR